MVMVKEGPAHGLPSHAFNGQGSNIEASNGDLTNGALNGLLTSSGSRQAEQSPASRMDSELDASPRMPGVPEDETEHSRVPGSQDPPLGALAPSPGGLSEGETESPNKSNLRVPSEQAGLARNLSREVLESGPAFGEQQLPPGSPLSEALELPENPPDDEAEHVLVPVARPTAEPKNGQGAGEETLAAPEAASSGEGGALPTRRPKPKEPEGGGVCGASLLDRGLFFVQVQEPPENYPVLKPCPGKGGSPDRRRGRQQDRSSPRRRGAGGAPAPGKEEFATTAESQKEQEEEDDEAAAAEKAKANSRAKRRTWTYYPPPNGDEDAVPVDVIDHESEVLIVRREPPFVQQPRRQLAMSANVSRRSHGAAAQPNTTGGQSKFVSERARIHLRISGGGPRRVCESSTPGGSSPRGFPQTLLR